MTVLMLNESDVKEIISVEEAVEAVENAFKSKGNGNAQMPPKSYVYFPQYNGDFRSMPAYLEELDVAGVKIVNVHPDNPSDNGLPSVMATIVLLDPETGKPISVMGGTKITDLRTGAAGAVAAKYLARDDSKTVGFIGTGAQARTQLASLLEVFDLEKGYAFSKPEDSRENFARDVKQKRGFEMVAVDSARKAVEPADIVVTVTPSRSPIVKDDWVSEGTHINAIGADAEGKQELHPEILQRGKIVVDEWDQAHHSGEINVPISEGILFEDDIYGDISEVVTGKRKGRESEEEITVFDSTGLAVQDVSVASRVYEKALGENVGYELDLMG